MKSKFPGFPPETRKFLRNLKRNNRREWFQPRKETFDEVVKTPMTELVLALGEAMRDFAPELNTDPKKAVYRIYRDTRFSKDKTPYKTWIAAVFSPRGFPKHSAAGAYFHIGPDEILTGGGIYSPGPPELRALRQHIGDGAEELRAILGSGTFRKTFGEMSGERLKRVPKGFAPDHPAADLLVHKQFLAGTYLDPAVAETPMLYSQLVKVFKTMMPFLRFLNTPLKPAK